MCVHIIHCGSLARNTRYDPLSYFSFQPLFKRWCNKGRGMCYPVCGMVHIKEPLLLIGNSSPCGGIEFALSLSEWSFIICLTPYNRILHGVDPLSYFSFQPVLHDWYNKGRGMCYPVCGMVHIKEPLLLIDKSSLCGDSGFPLSLSEWSLTICLTPYNRRQNVLSASLNKTFLSLSHITVNTMC